MVPFLLAFHCCWLVPVKEATGVPTSTTNEPHSQSRALPELPFVAIANLQSEFGQLEQG